MEGNLRNKLYKAEIALIKALPFLLAVLYLIATILEKFDMTKAKEVCERYRGILAQSITHADVYVAINSHYHDYCELFKAWFGDNIDQKIIESAIIFWFKDDDYEEGSKLWNYFKEN